MLPNKEEISQHLKIFFSTVEEIINPYFNKHSFNKRIFSSRGVVLFEINEEIHISVDFCNYIQYGISAFRVMINSPKHFSFPILDDDNNEQWRYSDYNEMRRQLTRTINKLEQELKIFLAN